MSRPAKLTGEEKLENAKLSYHKWKLKNKKTCQEVSYTWYLKNKKRLLKKQKKYNKEHKKEICIYERTYQSIYYLKKKEKLLTTFLTEDEEINIY